MRARRRSDFQGSLAMTTQPHQSNQDRVVIFDTTLRDGEQCPGATMTFEEKLEGRRDARQHGRRYHRGRFPDASDGDFEAVREIAKRTKNAVICGLSRAALQGHRPLRRSVKPRSSGRIHTFLSTSPVHMKYKLQMEPEQVFQMVISSVTRARNHTDDVEWSAEDGTRTEFDFLCRCVEAAIKAGATTINYSRHRRLQPCRKNITTCSSACARTCRIPTRHASRCIATTTSAWRSPIRWPGCAAAHGRSNAPSTASASAQAMRHSKKS
jgi:hypothetical protein